MTFPLSPAEINQIASKAPQAVAQDLLLAFNQAAVAEEDKDRKEALELILSVLRLGMYFSPADAARPFGRDGERNAHEIVSPKNAAVLGELSNEIETPELRALMADVAWLHRRGKPELARRAVEAYVESARATESADHWPDTVARVERALRLGRSLGSNDAAFEVAKNYALEVVHRYGGRDSLFLTGKIVHLLVEFKIGEASDYAGYVQHAASKAQGNKSYHVARYYFELLADVSKLMGDESGRIKALREVARTFEAEARDREAARNFMAAAHFFTNAIQAFRRTPGSDKEIEALRLDLQRVERASISEMKRIQSDSVDISGEITRARKHVTGFDLHTALLRFVSIVPLANADRKRELAGELAEVSIFRRLALVSHVDGEGRVIGREPIANDDEVTFAQLVEQYAHHRRFIVQAYLLPALDQINQEHSISLGDVVGFFNYSPFVPGGREMVFGKGLLAGFEMEMATAAHLLVPQIENSIRFLLESKGAITTKLDKHGVQRLHDLNELLIDERVESILSKDILIELRTLLVDNRGPNLRNRLAHGMIDDSEFMTAEVVYMWWLVLNLCLFSPRVKATELLLPSEDLPESASPLARLCQHLKRFVGAICPKAKLK
jgi:hypothetical protein